MGKKNIKKIQKANQPTLEVDSEEEMEVEEDNLSDLEMNNEEDDDAQEEINLVDELNTHTNKIKQEFAKLLQKKGANPNSWLETLTLTHDNAIDPNLNIDDDIRRELVFYNITNNNVMKGIEKLREV